MGPKKTSHSWLQISCLQWFICLKAVLSINKSAVVWLSLSQHSSMHFIYMSYTSQFSLLCNSPSPHPLFPFIKSLAIWGHLPCLVCQELSRAAMERKESQRRGWGESAIPNLLPKAPENTEWRKRKMWPRKEDCVRDSERSYCLLEKKPAFFSCYVRQPDFQTDLLNVSVWSGWQKKKGTSALKWPFIWPKKSTTSVHQSPVLVSISSWPDELNHRSSLRR